MAAGKTVCAVEHRLDIGIAVCFLVTCLLCLSCMDLYAHGSDKHAYQQGNNRCGGNRCSCGIFIPSFCAYPADKFYHYIHTQRRKELIGKFKIKLSHKGGKVLIPAAFHKHILYAVAPYIAGISVGDDKVYHGGYDHGSYTCKAGNGHGMEQGVKVPPACHKTHRYAYKYAYDGIRKHRMCPQPYYDIGGHSDYCSGNRSQGVCAEKRSECIQPARQLVFCCQLTSDTVDYNAH